ncbi:unnamed protein product, partial [Mesorhabditis spiculigera]
MAQAYQRKAGKMSIAEQSLHDEKWDDTELLQRFNHNVKGGHGDTPEQTQESKPIEWVVGDRCTAPYYADNMLYPAQITGLDRTLGIAEVLFDSYGNTEEVKIADLLGEDYYKPDEAVREEGGYEDEAVREEGGYEDEDDEGEEEFDEDQQEDSEMKPVSSKPLQDSSPSSSKKKNLKFNMPSPSLAPPPPPSMFMKDCPMPENMDEALSGMLMSWYMSGYHTGYYEALRTMQKKGQQAGESPQKKVKSNPVRWTNDPDSDLFA